MSAHVVEIETYGGGRAMLWHRWLCSCGSAGRWCSVARSARNGGARHVIAALYVERGGPYFTMPAVDPRDRERDARTYAGPWPIVAHPPCGPWGRLRHLYRGNEHDCAPAAIAAAREWGGVVEHPEQSRLWRYLALPEPGEFADAFGGFTVTVDQCAWGHVARKHTWLYIVGIPRSVAMSGVRIGGTPTHWIGGGGTVPPGIRICSAQQRRRTPPAFAAWLVELAAQSRPMRRAA